MSENKIPDFFEFVRSEFGADYIPTMLNYFDYSNVAIKFAKMHVKAKEDALEKNSYQIYNVDEENDWFDVVNLEDIKTVYPLENIK